MMITNTEPTWELFLNPWSTSVSVFLNRRTNFGNTGIHITGFVKVSACAFNKYRAWKRRGRWNRAPHIWNLSTNWIWAVVLPQVPTEEDASWFHRRFQHCMWQQNLYLCLESNVSSSPHQVPLLAEPCWLNGCAVITTHNLKAEPTSAI